MLSCYPWRSNNVKEDDELTNKCSNCGYLFQPQDGSICPECLTQRQEESVGGNNTSAYSQHPINNNSQNFIPYQPATVQPKKSNTAVIVIIVFAVFLFIGVIAGTLFAAINKSVNSYVSYPASEEAIVSEVSTVDIDNSDADNDIDVGRPIISSGDEYVPNKYEKYAISETSYKEYFKDDTVTTIKYGFDEPCFTNNELTMTFSNPRQLDKGYKDYPAYDGYKIVAVDCKIENYTGSFQDFYQDLVLETKLPHDYREYYSLPFGGVFDNQCPNYIYLQPDSEVNLTVYFEVPEYTADLHFAFYDVTYDSNDEVDYVYRYVFE